MAEFTHRSPPESYSQSWRAVSLTFADVLTQDPAFLRELKRAQAAASSDVAICLLGETGTGKTIVAQAIHNQSARRGGPFVRTNCAKFPETLVDSELFGHEKGSFTGADKQHKGAFELAHKGTLFLDEIGDMAQGAQAKILHALEYREFHRVGGEHMIAADVRFITATNRELEDAVAGGEFRADLYYRLAQCVVLLPPLRERKGDIPLYVEAFLAEACERSGKRIKKLTRAARRRLNEHDWPGNVRELRAVLMSAAAVCTSSSVEVEDLNLRPRMHAAGKATADSHAAAPAAAPNDPTGAAEALTLQGVEGAHIQRVLELTGGNKKRAAELLGISRPTLDRKIKSFGLTVK